MFSIVIPLYNKEKSITGTINSVLNQCYYNFELLIVNDGSTDHSLEVVKTFNDKRIKVFSKNNGGVCSARNYGIEKASYNWIAFLDADDIWEQNHLSILSKMIGEFPKEKIFYTTLNINKLEKSKALPYRIDEYFLYLNQGNKGIHSSSVLINKNCFKKVGYFNTQLVRGEDLEMWYRLAKEYSIIKTDKVTVTYNLEAENRAMNRKTDYHQSFASVISFKGITNESEIKYLKNQLKTKFKSCVYNQEWKSLAQLLLQFNFRII